MASCEEVGFAGTAAMFACFEVWLTVTDDWLTADTWLTAGVIAPLSNFCNLA